MDGRGAGISWSLRDWLVVILGSILAGWRCYLYWILYSGEASNGHIDWICTRV